MKKLNLLRFAPLLFLLVLLSCTQQPPDVPVCENLTSHLGTDPETGHIVLRPSPACSKAIGEAECGHCVWIMSKKEYFVGENPKYHLGKKPWSQIKRESIYVPAVESYAPLSAYIINACKQMNCDSEVDRFKIKLDSLSAIGSLVKDNP